MKKLALYRKCRGTTGEGEGKKERCGYSLLLGNEKRYFLLSFLSSLLSSLLSQEDLLFTTVERKSFPREASQVSLSVECTYTRAYIQRDVRVDRSMRSLEDP